MYLNHITTSIFFTFFAFFCQCPPTHQNKVKGPDAITYQTCVPPFKWCAVTNVFKSGYQRNLCLEEIELHA
jgi:hypothetical protein